LERAPVVDFVFGTHKLFDLPDILDRAIAASRQRRTSPLAGGEPRSPRFAGEAGLRREGSKIISIEEGGNLWGGVNPRRKSRISAYVAIMRGCDNSCSYCIVPYVRGRQKSRPSQEVVEEIEDLGSRGYKEVTLLGQNVNSYKSQLDFADLLREVNEIKGIERIRYISSHPRDMTDKLIEVLPELSKVCEHVHLPVQSGSNSVLSRMNRGYTRESYLKIIAKLRKFIPHISITTDIITGFPGESEADFADTMSLMEEVVFDGAFVFRYSPRRGTRAASMPEQILDDIKIGRLKEVIELQAGITRQANERLIGETLKVLVEGPSKSDPRRLVGRSRSNKVVVFEGSSDLIGMLVPVRITKAHTWALVGEVGESFQNVCQTMRNVV
jgi:tRNA-2-methylthio-N6-dimethylallyladenosine synthase